MLPRVELDFAPRVRAEFQSAVTLDPLDGRQFAVSEFLFVIRRHDLRGGIDADHIVLFESYRRAPVNYLREDGTLLRQSIFPAIAPFTRHNVELGAYIEDRWTPRSGFLIEPGLRFDWDEIIRRPLFSPRLAGVWSPARLAGKTKVSAGIGVYYGHTQLEYLTRSLAGIRYDTYFAPDQETNRAAP